MESSRSDIGLLSKEQIELASRRLQAKDRKARLGFIGAGWWATTNHIPLLQARRDVELVSVCGLDESLNKRIQEDFGFAHSTTDYRELLQQRLDGVVVSSPHSLHAEHTRAALQAGCHVMVEKPMATRARDASDLVKLSVEKGLQLLIPYGWNFRPLTLAAKRLMGLGKIGQIEHVMCHMGSPAKSLFLGKSFEHGDGSYVLPNLSTWTDPRLSEGGYGQGQLSHALGLLFWLTNLEPQYVFARMSHIGGPVDMYDSIVVSFEERAIGSLSGAATVPSGSCFQLDLRIFGSDGMLLFDVERERLEVHTHAGEHEIHPVAPGDGAYRCDEPPHQFVELILGLTQENNAPGSVGLKAVKVLDAAYRSAQSGREESIEHR